MNSNNTSTPKKTTRKPSQAANPSRLASASLPSMGATENQKEGSKSYAVTWLLALVFGVLGLDRFYLGYYITGALKLLTLGGFGLWSFVDLVLIIMGYQKDSKGLALKGRDQFKVITVTITLLIFMGYVVLAGQGLSRALSNIDFPDIESTVDEINDEYNESRDSAFEEFPVTLDALSIPIDSTLGTEIFDIKTSNYQRGLTPRQYVEPRDGFEFVSVDIEITNKTDEAQPYGAYDFSLEVDKSPVTATYNTRLENPVSELNAGTISVGGTVEATLLYEAPINGPMPVLSYTERDYTNGDRVYYFILEDDGFADKP